MLQTHIKSIMTHAFTLNKFNVFLLENAEVSTFGASIFYKTHITNLLKFQNTNVYFVEERAFASIIECKIAKFEHCIFGKFPIYGFENSKVRFNFL